jgi:hypothetical protein
MRTKKSVRSKQKEVTHVELSSIRQVTNASFLQESLGAGSKKHLSSYQKNLAVTKGQVPIFDSQLRDLVKRFAWSADKVDEAVKYLDQLADPSGISFSRCYKRYDLTQGTWEAFSSPDYSSFRWNRNYRESLEDAKKIFSERHLSPLRYHSDEDIVNAISRKNTHSGWTYIESGLKDKGDNLDGIYHRYLRTLKGALKHGSFARPILVGFRTQGSGEFSENGDLTGTCKHKTRVVCMVDLIQIVHELKYFYPLQDVLTSSSFYAGGFQPDSVLNYLTDWRSHHKGWWSIDYSKYDMTISSWLIEDAFDVLKTAFSYVDDDEWNLMVHDFIHKDFVINEGVVHADKGVPSGSMFTQIIDSLVNFIMVNTYFKSINRKSKMMIMGDDNIIFHDEELESVSDLASYIRKNFGIEVNADKSLIGYRSEAPWFLSTQWRVNGRWRHPNEIMSRMFFPERFRKYGWYKADDGTKYYVGPEMTLLAYALTYPLGCQDLFDVAAFRSSYPISKSELVNIAEKISYSILPGAAGQLLRDGIPFA